MSYFKEITLRKYEDTKGVNRSSKLKDRQYSDQKKKYNRTTMTYETLHRKIVNPTNPHTTKQNNGSQTCI